MLGFMSGVFFSKASSSLFAGEETHYAATLDNSRLICAYEKVALQCNKGSACVFPTGGALCGRHQRSNVTVYIKHLCLTHYASLGFGPSPVEIWMPNMESTAAWALITQQSHPSQTHAHTDTAVCSLINKKWKHEVLVGSPLKSSPSKSTALSFYSFVFLIFHLWWVLFLRINTFHWCDNVLKCRMSIHLVLNTNSMKWTNVKAIKSSDNIPDTVPKSSYFSSYHLSCTECYHPQF